MNSALTSLLRSNNTTISIAHRLSTIKRSDTIIVLGPDGRVAEQGSYKELSAKPDGAFTKLMEWQMSGGESGVQPVAHYEGSTIRGPPSEAEELQQMLQENEDEFDDSDADVDVELEGKAQPQDKDESVGAAAGAAAKPPPRGHE